MKFQFNKIFVYLIFIFFIQLQLTSYSNNIEKAILNNIIINEYDNNNISVKINTDNPLKKYETKQHSDITTIILPLTTISSNFKIEKCNCNNLVKNVEIQYLPYLNKNTNSYGYVKIRLYSNPDIQVTLEFNTNKNSSSNNKQTTIVKNCVINIKKSSKKFKSSNIMPIINNVRSRKEKEKFNIEDRRNKNDLNWDEEKLIEYKNSPIKFPLTKEIKLFISKNIFILFIGFILILLFVVLGVKKKILEGKIVRINMNKIENETLNNINEDSFLEFLENMQEINMVDAEVIDTTSIENIDTSTQIKKNIDEDEKFKKFLVEKVMNDITNINFCEFEENNNKLQNSYDDIYGNFEDSFAITFNQFIEESLTPKFDIKNDMAQIYNTNNQNEMEDLKKQIIFDFLNEDCQNQEIKSQNIEEEEKVSQSNNQNLLSNLNFNTNESLSFIKDENNNYSLLFSINGKNNIIKTYDKLKSKNLSMRLKDDENGIKTYVLRANSHKYLAKLDANNFEIIYEL